VGGQFLKAAEKNPSNSWSAIAWALERGFPSEFGRPEVQLNAQINSQTTTKNVLVITTEVANELERRAAPINREVDELLKAHEPSAGWRAQQAGIRSGRWKRRWFRPRR
jgi:hypothetical protein